MNLAISITSNTETNWVDKSHRSRLVAFSDLMFSQPYCLNPPQHLLLRKETQTTSLFEQKPDFVAFVGKMLRRRSNKTQFGTPSESVKVIDLYLYLHELTQKCASIFLVDPIPPKEKHISHFVKVFIMHFYICLMSFESFVSHVLHRVRSLLFSIFF